MGEDGCRKGEEVTPKQQAVIDAAKRLCVPHGLIEQSRAIMSLVQAVLDMNEEDNRDIPYFSSVVTTASSEDPKEWSAECFAARKWGATGVVTDKPDRHGTLYQVQHECGGYAWYNARELVQLKTYQVGVVEGEALPEVKP